ncbi:MAG: thiamine pyrophosphate-binding protein [Halobacteriota archaeon]|nr:thiamine pyrophosphate-binding protein [Halobacteriota archaeon]
MAKFRCTVCNWVYDEEVEGKKFADLPDSFFCPVCGSPKSAFVLEGVVKEEDESVKTTVADKIVEQLEAFGVRYIYGIPGHSNLPIIESVRKSDKIKFILTRHEETAAFMASAHGKMTDTLGVCISIAGPGSTNLITGLMDSATDRSPVLALAGQVPEVFLGSEAFQEIDQIDIFKPFSEYAQTIARSNQAVGLVTRAVKYAYKKPGVSVLSTPTDILVERCSDRPFSIEKRLFKNSIVSDDERIVKTAELINNCKRIAILAGWGSRHASDELIELSKILVAPIATTSRAKGVIDETYKYSLGVLGSIGSKHAAKAIRDCELVIIIGSGFRQANLVPSGVKTVQIDIDSTRVGKTFDVTSELIGDAKLILGRLLPLLNQKEEDNQFLDGINKIKAEHMGEIKNDSEDYSVPINPGFVIQAIKRNVKEDAIISVDVGDHTYWFYKKFVCEGQRTFLSANMASMGFALPASLSAKLDFPERQVICVTGDGGFGMLMADFTTAVREKLAIKVIIFNDGRLKNIKKEQMRDNYPEFGVNFPNPNFSKFAISSGGDGFRVDDPKELDEVFRKAFLTDKPTIIDVLIDPEKMAAATKKVD